MTSFADWELLFLNHYIAELMPEVERCCEQGCTQRLQASVVEERRFAELFGHDWPKAAAHRLCAIILESVLIQESTGSETNDLLVRCFDIIEAAKARAPKPH